MDGRARAAAGKSDFTIVNAYADNSVDAGAASVSVRVSSYEGERRAKPVVCHVLHTLNVGGGEVLARAFALTHAEEFTPVFALLDSIGTLGQELRDAGYQVEVIGRQPGFDYDCVRRLGRFFHRTNVSLVHAHQFAPLFYSAATRLPFGKIPILFTEHGRDYPDYRRWKRVAANRVLLKRRDRFVAVGECVQRALINYEGLSASRIQVIYNGRDLSDYDPQRPSRSTLRSELGVAQDDIIVIQVARLNRLKDQPTAIRVMKRLRDSNPEIKLLLVGDGEERKTIERMISDSDLSKTVHMLGERHDIPRLLQVADAFLLTSITEGIPLTLIEAMATGLPCVATDVGGVSEVVVADDTGLLSAAGNDAQLANQLRRLAEDAELRQRLGMAGCKRVRQCFDATAMHQAYRRLYCEMTGAEASSRVSPGVLA